MDDTYLHFDKWEKLMPQVQIKSGRRSRSFNPGNTHAKVQGMLIYIYEAAGWNDRC